MMVCGYRRSGKDFTGQVLVSGGKLTDHWNIYGHRRVKPEWLESHLRPTIPVVRSAFADALKVETATLLGMGVEELELSKDLPLPEEVRKDFPTLVVHGLRPTFRDILIDTGMRRRSECPNHWVKIVAQRYEPRSLNLVTDFRFLSELELPRLVGTQALTVRVVNRDVPIPGADEIVEHHLDDYTTDVLLTNYELDEIPNSPHSSSGWVDYLHHYEIVR